MLERLAPGASLGPYVLSQPLGRGSTATVFLARRADREVALKVRGRGDPELDRRFLREFEALRGLSVPGVVRVHDAGLDDRYLWYAMDVVHGLPIRSWIEAGDTVADRVARLLHVAPPLCDALAGVHRAGLMHRDLKPSNVLVDSHGLPHVLDFGVARAWVDGDPLTGEGGLVGTLPFMSPEQVAGQPLTPRCDLFAVGLMLYEGIVGKRPRPPRTQDWLRIQCLERPRPLASVDTAVPLEVSAVIDQLVALDPRDRPDAATAAALFRACADGRGRREWPEPHAYIGTPAVLDHAEALIRGEGPRVFVLAGPAGSGRRRTAEQIRRRALLGGLRTVRGRCRVERPGGAVEEILEALLEAPADAAWRRTVGGGDTGPLLEMWPHLPLEPMAGPGIAATAQEVVRAASAALVRAAGSGLLLVVEDLDEIDKFTARLLDRLARVAPRELAIVCVVDDRHATRRSQKMINELVRQQLATVHRLPDLDAASATALAQAMVPADVEVRAPAGSPLLATEAGLAALARARGVAPPRLPPSAFPAALEGRALHLAGWMALGVDADLLTVQGTLERVAPARFRVASGAARAHALSRTVRRPTEALRLAAAWAKDPGPDRHAARARALLLADDVASAFAPAVHAALEAERAGRFREARDWLVLVDSLPRDRASDAYARLRFSLAACRASVASAIGSERPREDLVAMAAARAVSDVERAQASLLGADLSLRHGDARTALVTYLTVASRTSAEAPDIAVRAGVRAAAVRIELGEYDDATRGLDRAEELRGGWRGDIEQTALDAVRTDVAIAEGNLRLALVLCQRGLRLAAGLPYLPGIAGHSQRLGLLCAWLGDRTQAEGAVERARRARLEAGERGGAAEAAAWLGWLFVGRGDAAAAKLLAQEALVVARRLNLRDVRSLALAVLLAVATTRGDVAGAAAVLDEHESLDAEPRGPFAAAATRWWRTQGEPARAAHAAEHAPATGFYAVETRLELVRVRLGRQDRAGALAILDEAQAVAAAAGFRELDLYARVQRSLLEPPPGPAWAALFEEASRASWIELFLWVLALDGHRRSDRGDIAGARQRFLELAARATEHGHQPFRQAAAEALGGF
ncbi:MAG: serine/threonine-protein kinase [Pseudomonadota bacterium]|nr:serine/threonine-protein kinase [Pseudomonadota bacterium]